MFKRILVPLDGSELSAQVLPVVERLVAGTDADVTLLICGEAPRATLQGRKGLRRPLPLTAMPGAFARGVIPAQPPTYAENRDQAVERHEHELLEYLEHAGRPLVEAGARVRTVARFGEPTAEIVEFARHGGFDLIVMATHGRSGLRDVLHGSVAAAVVRSAVLPVLVVRPTSGARQEPMGPRAEVGNP